MKQTGAAELLHDNNPTASTLRAHSSLVRLNIINYSSEHSLSTDLDLPIVDNNIDFRLESVRRKVGITLDEDAHAIVLVNVVEALADVAPPVGGGGLDSLELAHEAVDAVAEARRRVEREDEGEARVVRHVEGEG